MDAPQIQYAPRIPGEKRRRITRRIAQVVVLLILTPVLLKTGGIASRQLQLLFWQRRAMNYHLPPNQVVFDPSKGGTTVAAKEWARFTEIFSPPGRIPHATLFLHERNDPNGHSRLVAMECGYPPPGTGPLGLWLFQTVIKPASLFGEPKEEAQGIGPVVVDAADLSSGVPIQFFAGQPDPNDSSHFTVPFVVGKKSMVIDAWLLEDDRVDFSVRQKK